MRYHLYRLRNKIRRSNFGQRWLSYAHYPENINTWKHDLIEWIMYGKQT